MLIIANDVKIFARKVCYKTYFAVHLQCVFHGIRFKVNRLVVGMTTISFFYTTPKRRQSHQASKSRHTQAKTIGWGRKLQINRLKVIGIGCILLTLHGIVLAQLLRYH